MHVHHVKTVFHYRNAGGIFSVHATHLPKLSSLVENQLENFAKKGQNPTLSGNVYKKKGISGAL